MVEVSRCSKCGRMPDMRFDVSTEKWYIMCPTCSYGTSGNSAKKKAIEAWNKRTANVGTGQ